MLLATIVAGHLSQKFAAFEICGLAEPHEKPREIFGHRTLSTKVCGTKGGEVADSDIVDLGQRFWLQTAEPFFHCSGISNAGPPIKQAAIHIRGTSSRDAS